MMEKYHVIYSPAALEDIKSIYSYIAFDLKSPETAQGQTNHIRKGVEGLGSVPERFSQVDWEPWLSLGMRKLPIDNYVVYYLADSTQKTVTIIRIFYGGRDVKGIFTSETE